jgi:hypothetical protein
VSRLHFVAGDGCPDLAHLVEKIDRVPLTNVRWIDMRNPERFQASKGGRDRWSPSEKVEKLDYCRPLYRHRRK